MTIEEKIEVIKKNKEPTVAALNSYLDALYSMTDNFLDENGNLKDFLTPDEKGEKFVQSLKEDAKNYEEVRRKLLDDNFDLDLKEIARCGLSYAWAITTFDKNIEMLKKAKEQAEELANQIMEKKD